MAERPFFTGKKIMTTPFTIHVRLTKACNANCTYCSSFMENPDKFMSLKDYKKSITFIWEQLIKLDIHVTNLTIEYVGGEIMLVPLNILKSQVDFAREFFLEKGIVVVDGAQTNLIGSKRKVSQLNDIFNGKISTSIDSFTDQRKLGNSAKKYRVIMMQRESEITNLERFKIPAVFTMDQKSIKDTVNEFKLANRANRNLMIRPVFNGGNSIESITPEQLSEAMLDTFDSWFIRSNVILEPHFSLLKKRLQTRNNIDPLYDFSYCSFQNDCAKKSMSLEPNGDLHICQELADSNAIKIGNAVDSIWDQDQWDIYNKRGENLHKDCLECPYLKDCQGGCMMHSIEDNNGPYGKPSYCYAWKKIFKKIDDNIDINGEEKILSWIDRLESK